MTVKLVLASASPRRAELLKQMGVVFDVKAVDIDESTMAGEAVDDYVMRLALSKANAAKLYYQQDDVLVLGSDTSVVINGEILGKPRSKADALRMLRLLSGNTHRVLTSVVVLGKQQLAAISESWVTFAELSEEDLEWYWSTDEPKGKAGAYAIQGLAAMFVSRLEGSFSGVMGLPIYETSQLLKDQGFFKK